MLELSLPTIGTVLVTAVIDSINPCAIGVLLLLISTFIVLKKRSAMLKMGLIYIAAVFLVYFSAGLGLTAVLANIPQIITEYIAMFVGTLVVIGGLIEIKDYYWYGKGFSLMISKNWAKKIHKMSKNITVPGLIVLGAFVAAVELPCTGGPYLAITLILAQNFNLQALILLIIYNIIFVLPLVIILLLVVAGKNIALIKQWKHEKRALMRLATGIILILLGWLLILIANGTINLV